MSVVDRWRQLVVELVVAGTALGMGVGMRVPIAAAVVVGMAGVAAA